MKRYLLMWLGATGALLVSVASINLVVDPYGLFRVVDAAGFNAVKPKAGLHGATAKAYQVLRANPRTLILGNSRAEVGFAPDFAGWPAAGRPVFNLALPGTGPSTTLDYLQHAIAHAADGNAPRIERVVWGVDFPDFLTDATTQAPAGPAKADPRLLVGPDGTANGTRTWQEARDFGESLLTLSALIDSIQTVAGQSDAYSADLTTLGFNPMRDYLKIAVDEGYRSMFHQKDVDNTRAYVRRPKGIVDASGHTSIDLEAVRRVLDVARRNRIALTLVIYPIHAHLLEIIRITDHWTAFEQWKRAVVHVVADEARASGGAPFPLLDFSGFLPYATETIPPRGDRKTAMRWYWEAGHFKRELGDLVLGRVLETPNEVRGFGSFLDASTVEEHLASLRAAEVDYRTHHADEVEELERLAVELKPRK